MNSILNNPYRILGLLANASAREINTRVNKLRMYIEADEEVPKNDDYGFPDVMGNPQRSNASVDKAKSELNLDKDRVANALFWFWKNNDISDEAAFDALKEGDTDTAIGIWQKLTERGEVTERNRSAFLNLSTLLLYQYTCNRRRTNLLKESLRLKIQFLESSFSEEFVKKVGDETYRNDTVELELLLLNQIRHELEKAKGEIVGMLPEWNFKAKDKFLKELAKDVVKDISDKVKTCSDERNKTPGIANIRGEKLFNFVEKDLLLLKKTLGESNLTYNNLADEVAEELLQCAIDSFNYYQNSDMFKIYETSSASINLIRNAQSIAIGNRVKQRCNENLEIIQRCYDTFSILINQNGQKSPKYKPAPQKFEPKFQPVPQKHKDKIPVFWFSFSGSAFWVGVKWVFWVSLFFFGIFALLEYQWHAWSAPTSQYMHGLPYSCILIWFFYTSYGITKLIGRSFKAFGIFLRFLANVAMLLFYMYYYPIIQEKEVLSMLDKVSFVAVAFFILMYAFYQINITLKNSPGYNMNLTIFKQNGPPGLIYLNHFFRQLTVPLIVLTVVFLGDLTISSFWQAVLWIGGFLLVWDNIRMMLVCNIRKRNNSSMSIFLYTQHRMLSLPEAGAFLIWYFDWWPTPLWVTIVYTVYGSFWLLATIGLLIQMKKK